MDPIEQRIERSLARLGCNDVRAYNLGRGTVKLMGTMPRQDAHMAMLATKTIPYVRRVLMYVTYDVELRTNEKPGTASTATVQGSGSVPSDSGRGLV